MCAYTYICIYNYEGLEEMATTVLLGDQGLKLLGQKELTHNYLGAKYVLYTCMDPLG